MNSLISAELQGRVFNDEFYREYVPIEIDPAPPIPRGIRPIDDFDLQKIKNLDLYYIYVPPGLTIQRVIRLFKNPFKGSPCLVSFISRSVQKQLGDKPIPSGWFCMPKGLVGMEKVWVEQCEEAKKLNMKVADLGVRILFNFLIHLRTDKYPDVREKIDGQKERMIIARTGTMVYHPGTKQYIPVECGAGDEKGLDISPWTANNIDTGLAVTL